tara:strand:+ start:183 stop:467 length:285 start_codon:yes stop_codon:yes gene_type:complete
MNNEELIAKVKELEKNQMKLFLAIPTIIENFLLEKGILEIKQEITEEDILNDILNDEKIAKELNKTPGPKIGGTANMTKEEFKKYNKQLKEAKI